MGGNKPEIAAYTIDSLRAQDEKSSNQEVIPEKQTLDPVRVLNFLHKNGIVLSGMESTYTLDTSLKLMAEGGTASEKMMAGKFTEAKNILAKYERLDVMQEHDQGVVTQQLENLKTPPKNMSPAEAAKVMQAWNYHDLVREHAKRLLLTEESMKDKRENEMHPHQGVGEAITDKLHEARLHWDTLSGGQKLMFAGIALLGGAMLLKSENETMKKIKDTLFTGVKIAGVGWLLNKSWYLFTGESAVDAITGSGQASTKSSQFMKETFKTDDKGAEVLNKAMVQIGDNNFMDLLDRYEAAKSSGINRIEGTRMPPGEAYRAMEIFCTKYNPELLRKAYSKYNPPIALTQVVMAEMSKDPDVKMKDSLVGRVIDGVGDKFKEGYNYFASTGPAVWVGQKYRSIFGKDPSPEEAADFISKFDCTVDTPADFQKAVETKLAAGNIAAAKKFIDCDLSGTSDTKYGVKYKDGGDGYMYVIFEKDIGSQMRDPKGVNDSIQGAMSSAEGFLANKFNKNVTDVAKKTKPYGSVLIKSNTRLKYLVTYKK